MSRHEGQHENVLRRVVTGEIERDSSAWSELLASCDTCRLAWEEVQNLRSMFHEESRELEREASELAALALDEPRARGEDEALLGFRQQLEAESSTAGRWATDSNARRWLPLFALAAATVVALFGPWRWSEDPKPTELDLGPGSVELRVSLAGGASQPALRWGSGPAGTSEFELAIYDEAFRTLARERTRATVWMPGTDVTATWPETILWEITAFDAAGIELGSGSGSASWPGP